MSDAATSARFRAQGADEAAALVRNLCIHLPEPEKAASFGAFFDRYANARVVLLGEATHGTSEFYKARAAVTQRLITEHGFNIVAVEADWPDAARIDRHVRHLGLRHHPSKLDEEDPFARFPTWMWRNEEVAHFTHWLRAHNEHAASKERVEFRGLDVYSLRASMAAVLVYLDRVDPTSAALARDRYGCLSPWQDQPSAYGRSILRGEGDLWEDAVVTQLRELLANRPAYALQNGEDWFDAVQNARIVRAAEQYYRLMFHGGTASWNLRDRHMFDTLKYLLEARGPQAKAVVWAHNSHIGDASATALGWQGEFNIGELCRKSFGANAALIGFGTDRGTVSAADNWDEPMQIMRVRPARDDSYERIFRQSGVARSLTDLRGNEALREPVGDQVVEDLRRPYDRHMGGFAYPKHFLLNFGQAGKTEFDGEVAPRDHDGGRPLGARVDDELRQVLHGERRLDLQNERLR